MNYLKFAEDYSLKFGFNIIRMSEKKPFKEKISLWFEKDRKIDLLRKLDWSSTLITGVGVIIRKELIVFDFDKVNNFNIVNLFLEELGLGKKYNWIVKSGSGIGYHVFVNVKNKEELIKKLGDKNIFYFYPKNQISIDHLEVRTRNCYVVLSPSLHPDTKKVYEYLYGLPSEKPAYVDENKIIAFLNQYFNDKKKYNEKIRNENAKQDKVVISNQSTKHINSAIDFIKEKYFDYQDWNKLCFALASLGEKGRDYFIRLSKNDYWSTPDERVNEEFNNCLKAYDPARSNLSTLFQYAINRGFKYAGSADNFSRIFYEFKLSVLQLPDKDLVTKIMDYSMFREAIEQNNLTDKKEILVFIKNQFQTELNSAAYKKAFSNYKKLKKHSDTFEKKYGTDVYCRVGKDFIRDVLNKKFKMTHFRTLCAIQGILGKSDKFKPIGKERIAYAILGYKSSEDAIFDGINEKHLIKDSTLKSIIRNLLKKDFFRRVTYSKWAFYSTQLSREELTEAASKWLADRRRKHLKRLDNKPFVETVKNKLRKVDEEFASRPLKSMRLIKMPLSNDSQK